MMEQLAAALGRHGVDTGSLRPLWPAAGGGLYRLTTTGQGALRLWRKLRELVDETGHWPVHIGGEVDALSLVQDLEALRAVAPAGLDPEPVHHPAGLAHVAHVAHLAHLAHVAHAPAPARGRGGDGRRPGGGRGVVLLVGLIP